MSSLQTSENFHKTLPIWWARRLIAFKPFNNNLLKKYTRTKILKAVTLDWVLGDCERFGLGKNIGTRSSNFNKFSPFFPPWIQLLESMLTFDFWNVTNTLKFSSFCSISGFWWFQRPSNSPDLPPRDFLLFLKLESVLQWRNIQAIDAKLQMMREHFRRFQMMCASNALSD